MTACHIHTDREARVTCQKANFRGYCETCLEEGAPCFDPGIYCKFRSQCIIWELARENGLHRANDGETDSSEPEQLEKKSAVA